MSLFRSAATVGGFTMISRILGFIRDMLFAAVLGTGPVADAFVVAFRFPNLFRRLFGEGAFNAAFVPLFAKRLDGDGEAGARAFGEEILGVLVVTLVIFTVICELAMPWLMFAIAPGFADTPDKFGLAIVLTQIAFPYLMFMSLVALFSGVLNSLGRFAAAAAAPILLNIVLISVLSAAVLLAWGDTPHSGRMLAWGVSAAGVLQLVMLVAACARAGMALRLRRPRITPNVKRLVTLGIPGVIAGGITQVNLLIGTIIASLQASAVSYLYFADRVYQLPLGVVGIAIGVVLLPDLSRKLRANDGDGAHDSQNRALEFSMLLTVPAAVALVALPQPVIQVLFERGAFGPQDTAATASALAAFALGLPAFVLIKVFSPGFFAHEDTKTPMYFACIGMATNVLGSLVLFYQIGHAGIALATSAAGWLNAGLLGVTLMRRGVYVPDSRLKARLPKIVAISLVMGVALWWAGRQVAQWFSSSTGLETRVALLACLVLGGMAIFFALAEVSGAMRLREFKALIKRRK